MKNKKIAILLSGHLRCVSKTFANMREKNPEFFDSSVTDFFVHTWAGENKSCWTLYPSKGWKFTRTTCPSYMCKMFPISYIEDRVNLVSKLEEDDNTSESTILFGHNKFMISIASMLYARSKVYKMFEEYCNTNNQTYDLVIRTRPDIRYDFSVPVNELIQKIQNKECEFFVPTGQEWGGISDQMGIGSMRGVKIACDLWETIKANRDLLLQTYTNRLPESVEGMLAQHITSNGLAFEKLPIPHGLYRYVEITDEVMNSIRESNDAHMNSTGEEARSFKPIEGHPYGFSQADIDCGLGTEKVEDIIYLTFRT